MLLQAYAAACTLSLCNKLLMTCKSLWDVQHVAERWPQQDSATMRCLSMPSLITEANNLNTHRDKEGDALMRFSDAPTHAAHPANFCGRQYTYHDWFITILHIHNQQIKDLLMGFDRIILCDSDTSMHALQLLFKVSRHHDQPIFYVHCWRRATPNARAWVSIYSTL